MQRVLVIGSSGSGKSTVARTIAHRLAVPHIELDALFHGPGWTQRATFVEDVDHATSTPAWVADGNYSPVRDLLWSRADTVVWLDLPRWLVEWQVIRRSFSRWLARETLWNGNREPGPHRWIEPEHPVRWSWTKHAEYRVRYGERFTDPAFTHLRRVRLRSRAEVEAFLATIEHAR